MNRLFRGSGGGRGGGGRGGGGFLDFLQFSSPNCLPDTPK